MIQSYVSAKSPQITNRTNIKPTQKIEFKTISDKKIIIWKLGLY